MADLSHIVDKLKRLGLEAERLVHGTAAHLADELEAIASSIRGSLNAAAAVPAVDSMLKPASEKAAPAHACNGEASAADAQASMEEAGLTSCSGYEPPTKKQRQEESGRTKKGDVKARRVFDFAAYQQRFVALEVLYVGWGMHGFARQDTTENTVEGHLFKGLRHVHLIPDSIDYSSLRYSRCGRTDKGVSAMSQVVALLLRSNARADAPALTELEQEMNYTYMLNRVLPPSIRILGWAPAPDDFNARFSTRYRQYKYFIVQDGSLDLAAMQQAASYFLGERDFRHFCKPDVPTVKSYTRHIVHFSIEPAPAAAEGARVYAITVRGSAFLWHQVRCMAAVLLMVGRRLEQPEVVQQLLDVTANPRKPQYHLAHEEPLLLHECGYSPSIPFRRTSKAQDALITDLTTLRDRHLIGAAIAATALERVLTNPVIPDPPETYPGGKGKGKASKAGKAAAAAAMAAAAVEHPDPAALNRCHAAAICAAETPAATGCDTLATSVPQHSEADATEKTAVPAAADDLTAHASTAEDDVRASGNSNGHVGVHTSATLDVPPLTQPSTGSIYASRQGGGREGPQGSRSGHVALMRRGLEPTLEERFLKYGIVWTNIVRSDADAPVAASIEEDEAME